MRFAPLGDGAVVVTLGSAIDDATLLKVRSLVAALERDRGVGIVDVVPAYASVAVFYDVAALGGGEQPPFERICRLITDRVKKAEHAWPDLVKLEREGEAREAVEIPVCYGGDFGPDIDEVARHCGIEAGEVMALHSSARYVVHAVGFTPGFAYLGGLPEKLQTPRKATPRTSVPAGSVGIGGKQTGVYPVESPGGWQLIGRTPLRLFDPTREPAATLRVGDQVVFRAVSPEEFAAWK